MNNKHTQLGMRRENMYRRSGVNNSHVHTHSTVSLHVSLITHSHTNRSTRSHIQRRDTHPSHERVHNREHVVSIVHR